MPNVISILICCLGLLLIPFRTYSQEEPISDPDSELEVEESAELFLESYSDDFQESFFEALKQKGIQNYDKAINAFLKCKQIDASNVVVDHELAKVYYASKQYPLAEEYALTAVTSEPENYWYTDTFVRILEKQGKNVVNTSLNLPFELPEFNENLASIYLKKGNYETALNIITKAKQSSATMSMTSKIKDSIQKRQTSETTTSGNSQMAIQEPDASEEMAPEPNALEAYRTEMEALIQSDSIPDLQELSAEALESYPAQPYFYFAQGYALRKTGENEKAIETLETALDFLIDDTALENKIYQELANVYTALNDAVKANMYLRKIKSGF